MKKTKKAFSLIEVLFAVLLLASISLFFLPSASTSLNTSRGIKDTADTCFILEEAVETSRNEPFGSYIKEINGKVIEIDIEPYQNQSFNGNYKKIRASIDDKSFELIEVLK